MEPKPLRDIPETYASFVREHTARAHVPFVDVALHLATEVTPLWHATEAWLAARDVPPPFWAFAWVGGLALARHVKQTPSLVRGLRVLDFATGSGLVGICAAQAGAHEVRGVDIDPFAVAAAELNAQTNGVRFTAEARDVLGQDVDEDVVLAGDVLYERGLAERVLPWLREQGSRGKLVLVGDPGRAYADMQGMDLEGVYDVPAPLELEGRDLVSVQVRRVRAAR